MKELADGLHSYFIDGTQVSVRIDNAADAVFGAPAVLSSAETDITATQPWYDQGFTVTTLFTDREFSRFRSGIESALRAALSEMGQDTSGFALEHYHRFVDDDAHAELVSKTRSIFQQHLPIDLVALHERLGHVLGRALTDKLPGSGPDQSITMPMIIRLNRPGSGDFNPVHKDIYEPLDHLGVVPSLVNFWIPVAGVGPLSALPIAPGSHRLEESAILRTRAGSIVEGRNYRVNAVLEWGGARSLERVRTRPGEVLIFSSHLIHGLAINAQADTTRIAVEFRLGPV